MNHHLAFIATAALSLLLAACGDAPQAQPTPATSAAPASDAGGRESNVLQLEYDGQRWSADREWFGAVHPAGYDRAIIMAGSLGPRDAGEQSFNLNLYGVDKPGTYRVSCNGASGNAAQLANLSTDRYLIGGALGCDLTVELLRFSAAPTLVEARFQGTMIANDGTTIAIRNGHFRYAE